MEARKSPRGREGRGGGGGERPNLGPQNSLRVPTQRLHFFCAEKAPGERGYPSPKGVVLNLRYRYALSALGSRNIFIIRILYQPKLLCMFMIEDALLSSLREAEGVYNYFWEEILQPFPCESFDTFCSPGCMVGGKTTRLRERDYLGHCLKGFIVFFLVGE